MHLDILTPAATETPEAIIARYPARALPDPACVTRVGPSPTGFMHIGGLYAALVSQRVAHQSGGVFFLRIEDTDRKREVEGAVELIISSLDTFGVSPDEGETATGAERGAYGPYRQSHRMPIYQAFVRRLIEEGKAYPCFATPAALERSREEQTALKIPPGYYGRWAVWRDRSAADIDAALASGTPFVIRLRAPDDQPERIVLADVIRGDLTFPPNEQDVVLLKADGYPTYHLAHVVDDHLMGTTDVIRGHEWLSSYPLHAQLFDAFGWARPRFAHISPIEKMVGSSRRKLSKRHDPEASVEFYQSLGYPRESVIDYLLTLADGRFEDWRRDHPDDDAHSYTIDLARMNKSGALFDLVKLDSISRELIGRMSAAAIYDAALAWAQAHDADFAALLAQDRDYAVAIFGIERSGERVRKDIAKWSDVPADLEYFFDARFVALAPDAHAMLAAQEPRPSVAVLRQIAADYDAEQDRDQWLEMMRHAGGLHGYAPNAKTFKASPGVYAGHFGDVAGWVRLALCARRNTPDLFEVMQVLGPARIRARIGMAVDYLEASLG